MQIARPLPFGCVVFISRSVQFNPKIMSFCAVWLKVCSAFGCAMWASLRPSCVYACVRASRVSHRRIYFEPTLLSPSSSSMSSSKWWNGTQSRISMPKNAIMPEKGASKRIKSSNKIVFWIIFCCCVSSLLVFCYRGWLSFGYLSDHGSATQRSEWQRAVDCNPIRRPKQKGRSRSTALHFKPRCISNRNTFQFRFRCFLSSFNNLWRIALFAVRLLIVKIDLVFRLNDHRKMHSHCSDFPSIKIQFSWINKKMLNLFFFYFSSLKFSMDWKVTEKISGEKDLDQ